MMKNGGGYSCPFSYLGPRGVPKVSNLGPMLIYGVKNKSQAIWMKLILLKDLPMGTTEPPKFFPNSIMGSLWGPICDFPIFIFGPKRGLIMIFFEMPFAAKRRNVELKDPF
jgi:hypothetical protein